MIFTDITQSIFLEQTTAISLTELLSTFFFAVVTGFFIAYLFQKNAAVITDSCNYAVVLSVIAVIMAMITLAVKSDLVLSLGMVGALSILRLRTAIRNPAAAAYLFWAVADGILIGAGMVLFALCANAAVGIVLFLFASGKPLKHHYIAVIRCENIEAEQKAEAFLKQNVQKSVLESKHVQQGVTELSCRITVAKDNTSFLNDLSQMDGIADAVLISCNSSMS